MMLALTIISSIAAVAAIWYARKQTLLSQTLAARQDEQQREVFDWQRRHEQVALILSRIRPQMLVQSDDRHQGALWPTICPDNRLREQAETYVVEPIDNNMRLAPRKPTELELRSPQLRETVDKMIKMLEGLREKRPDLYKYIG
jgi:hypothetical protein